MFRRAAFSGCRSLLNRRPCRRRASAIVSVLARARSPRRLLQVGVSSDSETMLSSMYAPPFSADEDVPDVVGQAGDDPADRGQALRASGSACSQAEVLDAPSPPGSPGWSGAPGPPCRTTPLLVRSCRRTAPRAISRRPRIGAHIAARMPWRMIGLARLGSARPGDRVRALRRERPFSTALVGRSCGRRWSGS